LRIIQNLTKLTLTIVRNRLLEGIFSKQIPVT